MHKIVKVIVTAVPAAVVAGSTLGVPPPQQSNPQPPASQPATHPASPAAPSLPTLIIKGDRG